MSIDIRYFTNGTDSIIRVRNSGVTPVQIDFYKMKEEVPYSIRHYCPDSPRFADRDIADMYGVAKYLYPDAEKCILKEYKNNICIRASCNYWDKGIGACLADVEEENREDQQLREAEEEKRRAGGHYG